MTRKEFDRRAALIAEGKCPRCEKPVSEWPLHRVDRCHTTGSAVCGRLWNNIHGAERFLLATSVRG